MKTRSLGLLVLLCLSMTGCMTTQSKQASHFIFDSQTDTYIHENSGFRFPPVVGKFERGDKIREFDFHGNDVSVAYNLIRDSHRVVCTVYVYKEMNGQSVFESLQYGPEYDSLFNEHYEIVKNSIFQAYRLPRLLRENDFILDNSLIGNKGKKAVFALDTKDRGMLYSHLYLFSRREWVVKYRITYPSQVESLSETDIGQFIRLLKWPERFGH